MAEYDNLLAEALDLGPATQQEDRLLIQKLAEMGRALQTENTELREKAGRVKDYSDRYIRRLAAECVERFDHERELEAKLTAAERVITEALNPGGNLFTAQGREAEMRKVLSSYPLGEEQTPKLDPTPYLWPSGDREAWASTDHTATEEFAPESQYSQNRAEYEGQTQQGDER